MLHCVKVSGYCVYARLYVLYPSLTRPIRYTSGLINWCCMMQNAILSYKVHCTLQSTSTFQAMTDKIITQSPSKHHAEVRLQACNCLCFFTQEHKRWLQVFTVGLLTTVYRFHLCATLQARRTYMKIISLSLCPFHRRLQLQTTISDQASRVNLCSDHDVRASNRHAQEVAA